MYSLAHQHIITLANLLSYHILHLHIYICSRASHNSYRQCLWYMPRHYRFKTTHPYFHTYNCSNIIFICGSNFHSQQSELLLLKTLIPQKDYEAITGIVSNKTDLKAVIADTLEEIGHTTLAYCTEENQIALAASFHYSSWDVLKMKEEDILPMVKRISKLLTPLLTDVKFMEYEITDAMLASLLVIANTYDESIATKGTTSNDTSAANTSITEVCLTMLAQIRQIRLLNARYKKSQPDFYKDLILNTRTQHPATRSTGIQGHVLNKLGKGIPGLTVRIVGTDLFATTDADGYYIIVKLFIGTYTLQTSNEGGDSDLHEVEVFYRHITTQDFSL